MIVPIQLEWKNYTINQKTIDARVTTYNDIDQAKKYIRDLYFNLLEINTRLKNIQARIIQLTEVISENAFCLHYGSNKYVRVDKIKDETSSCDCIHTETGERVQIKASSVQNDLSSFGPSSEWDGLYFMDFSKNNGYFKITKIDSKLIYEHKMNKKETFLEQQKQNRRPRLCLNKLITQNNLTPIYEGNL